MIVGLGDVIGSNVLDISLVEGPDLYIYSLRFAEQPMEHHHSYSLLKFEDHERTTTGLTPSSCPHPFKFSPKKSNDHSTYMHELAQEEIPPSPEYRLHSRILKHTQIT